MSDYKEMYFTLFNETSKAIALLQAAQQKTEELYLQDDGASCHISEGDNPGADA